MEFMIPFYYAVAALILGLFGGFCTRCYQVSERGNFFLVLKCSFSRFARKTLTAFLLPVFVIFSEDFRKMLLSVLIYEAEEDYTVSISDADKDSLIDVLLERSSVYDIVRIALYLSLFYFINIDYVTNSMIRDVANETNKNDDSFSVEVSKKFFGKGLAFYKSNAFARTMFCL